MEKKYILGRRSWICEGIWGDERVGHFDELGAFHSRGTWLEKTLGNRWAYIVKVLVSYAKRFGLYPKAIGERISEEKRDATNQMGGTKEQGRTKDETQVQTWKAQ